MKSHQFLAIFPLLLLSFLLQAAGPFMHIYLADHWQRHHESFDGEELTQFYLGTLYPDSRYLTGKKRAATHPKRVSLAQIQTAKSPFEKGVLLHAYIDSKRYRFVRSSGIHQTLSKIPSRYRDTFLKFLEDSLIVRETRWQYLVHMLSKVKLADYPPHTRHVRLADWHQQLIVYFALQPEGLLPWLAAADKPFFRVPASELETWPTLLADLRNNPRITGYLQDMVTTLLQRAMPSKQVYP